MLSSNMKWIWINIVFLTFLTACTEKKQTEWGNMPKVESTATMQMKEEAQNYIEQLSIL